MILIISSCTDSSTHKVCEWLLYKGINDFVVVNELNAITSIEINIKPSSEKNTVYSTTHSLDH